MRLFFLAELSSRFDSMPFLKTSPAAGGRRMLGHEHRMVFQWSLLAVIGRVGGGESLFNQIFGVLKNLVQPLGPKIIHLARA